MVSWENDRPVSVRYTVRGSLSHFVLITCQLQMEKGKGDPFCIKNVKVNAFLQLHEMLLWHAGVILAVIQWGNWRQSASHSSTPPAELSATKTLVWKHPKAGVIVDDNAFGNSHAHLLLLISSSIEYSSEAAYFVFLECRTKADLPTKQQHPKAQFLCNAGRKRDNPQQSFSLGIRTTFLQFMFDCSVLHHFTGTFLLVSVYILHYPELFLLCFVVTHLRALCSALCNSCVPLGLMRTYCMDLM